MRPTVWIVSVATLCTGCAASAPQKTDVDAEIAARQGEAVDRICFTRNRWLASAR